MSLRECLEQRRASEPPVVTCVVTSSPSGHFLQLSTWRGENWFLPWPRLEYAQFSKAKGHELVVLSFSRNRVTISGENLHTLRNDLAAYRISLLREFPSDYRVKVGADAPFITQIQVEDRVG